MERRKSASVKFCLIQHEQCVCCKKQCYPVMASITMKMKFTKIRGTRSNQYRTPFPTSEPSHGLQQANALVFDGIGSVRRVNNIPTIYTLQKTGETFISSRSASHEESPVR